MGFMLLLICLLGFATSKFTQKWYTLPFGIISFLSALILILISTFNFSYNNNFEFVREKSCNNLEFDVSEAYNISIDKIMCSSLCKCDLSIKEKIEQLGDDKLRQYSRTIKLKKGKEQDDYNKNKYRASVVPLQFERYGYKSFINCYNETLIHVFATTTDPKM